MRTGHPWVFEGSIASQNRPADPGELAVIYDRADRFLAVGLYDPQSPIRVRILHAKNPSPLDEAWWMRRLTEPLLRRVPWFGEDTTGFRLINGESDGWPGLVMDRYEGTWVLKLYTAAWFPWLERIKTLLRGLGDSIFGCERLLLRLSRNIQGLSGAFDCYDGQFLFGPDLASPVTFLENGIRFEADVLRGQKTGFFLDQRENRKEVERLAENSEVLNAFSFSGGFSLYAARGGARRVTDVDISAHALASSARNFQLNATDSRISRCQRDTVQADVFEWLKTAPPRSRDLVILDPPSLAKREPERAGAIRSYRALVGLGMELVRPGGVLLAASCSAHVSAQEFFAAARQTAARSKRRFAEMKTTRHAPDHAASFPEAEYLKAIYLRIES